MDAAVTLNAADMHADADAAAVRADAGRRHHDGTVGAGRAPRTRPVVAQVGGRGRRGEPAGIGRGEETSAGRQADIGVRRVLVVVAEPVEVVARDEAGEARVHSVPSVIRLEMATPAANGATA